MNGSGRYIEYFYATTGNTIVYLAQNSEDGMIFQNKFTEFEVEKPAFTGLTRSDKIALGVGIGVGLPTLVVGIAAVFYARKAIKVKLPGNSKEGKWHKTKVFLARFLRSPKPKSNGHGAATGSSGSSL